MTLGANIRRKRRKRLKTGQSTMLGSTVEALQSYVLNAGVIGVVEGLLGILAFGGILSALLGRTSIRAAAIVAVIVAVLGLFALLAANKLEWRRRTELDRRLLLRYCNLLHERCNFTWRVTDWRQVVTIEANGDTHDKITFTAVPDCDALDFLTFWEGPNWDWPARYQRKTQVHVRSVELEGEGGTRFDATTCWLSRGRLKVLVHLSEPALRDTEISLVAEFSFPAKCQPFVQGAPEEFVKRFSPGPEHLEYTVVLPPGCSGYWDGVGLKSGTERYSIQRRTNTSGREEISLIADRVRNGARVGMKLDIK
ncbi:hypothetical protein SK803_00270 [Lentzea sp. BCCO 10_0856]|uniref:Uncharacterized protein n=1 Tax=Lentzea miocenica TaxID=3095431 RepID=A0ABU4SS30_9PSEU|nr:hypothetical protein [Lentzea sp. BCCO 10_0856]MDX8028617.1 hypothetical protein [Lentzea sp. BCCO 10_0856]